MLKVCMCGTPSTPRENQGLLGTPPERAGYETRQW